MSDHEAAASAASEEVATAAARAEKEIAALKAKVDESEAAASATSQEVATAAAREEELKAALKAAKDKCELAKLDSEIASNDNKILRMDLEELARLRARASKMKSKETERTSDDSLPNLDHVPDVLLGTAKKYLRHRRCVDFKELHGEKDFKRIKRGPLLYLKCVNRWVKICYEHSSGLCKWQYKNQCPNGLHLHKHQLKKTHIDYLQKEHEPKMMKVAESYEGMMKSDGYVL